MGPGHQIPLSQLPGGAARALDNQTCFPDATRTHYCWASVAEAEGEMNGQPAGLWDIYTNFGLSASTTSLRGVITMKSFVVERTPGPSGGAFKITAFQEDTLNGIANGTKREIHSQIVANIGGAQTGTPPNYDADQIEVFTPLFRSANAWAQARFSLRTEW